jgi:lipopolysaccharide export system protein LptA
MSAMRRLRTLLLAALLAAGAGAADAQVALGKRHDTSQQIEITADSLEVQQDKQVAIFSGNVDAVQGDIRLKADQLRVHYREGGDGSRAQGGEPSSQIRRIDAVGNVFVSSPEETGKGDRGTYDVERRVIVLEGQVVLTSGKNILRGNRATMNLDTGRSTMETAPGGRVRGLFVPSQSGEKR